MDTREVRRRAIAAASHKRDPHRALDRLEWACTQEEYYRLNHASAEQIQWLASIFSTTPDLQVRQFALTCWAEMIMRWKET